MRRWTATIPGTWFSSDGESVYYCDGQYFGFNNKLEKLSPDEVAALVKELPNVTIE